MAVKNNKSEKASQGEAKKFKGVVAKQFKASKVIYKAGETFSTNSKKGLDNLINNGFIESSSEKEAVDKSNKNILKWQQ